MFRLSGLAIVLLVAVLAGDAATAGPKPAPAGQWDMKFTTTANEGFRDPAVGSSRTRLWNFERACRDGACRLIARRETTAGFVTVPVTRKGTVFISRWTTRVSCKGRSYRYRERVSFTVTEYVELEDGTEVASALRGRLTGRAGKNRCLPRGGHAEDRIEGERRDLPN